MRRTTGRRVLPAVCVAAVGALVLAACGGSGGTPSTATTTAAASSAIGGGSAACDQATFDAWVDAWAKTQGSAATLADGRFACADGWAVLFPTVGEGADGFDTTVVVQAEGPVWALMDRGRACGRSEEDSRVPAALYERACTTS